MPVLGKVRKPCKPEPLALNGIQTPLEGTWERLVPLLDQAMGSLRVRDQDAILLRYFQGMELRQIAETMRMSVDCARKLADRALDECRRHLSRHGLSLSASTLSALLAAHAVSVAPAGLCVTVSRLALSRAAT